MAHVEEIRAGLGDDGALARLLAAIPLPPSVRELLSKPFFGRRWHREQQCDYWLASDGENVVCLRIHGADGALVARVRARFDDLRRKQPGLGPTRKILRELLAAISREDDRIA